MTKQQLARAIDQAEHAGLAYATIDMVYRTNRGEAHVPAIEVCGVIFEDYSRWLTWLTWDTSSDAEALASADY